MMKDPYSIRHPNSGLLFDLDDSRPHPEIEDGEVFVQNAPLDRTEFSEYETGMYYDLRFGTQAYSEDGSKIDSLKPVFGKLKKDIKDVGSN